MAKHPVPKKKMSNARTAHRYASFAHKKHVRLHNFVNVVPCASCGNPRLNQAACPSCGVFRGRPTRDVKAQTAKIVKVKA